MYLSKNNSSYRAYEAVATKPVIPETPEEYGSLIEYFEAENEVKGARALTTEERLGVGYWAAKQTDGEADRQHVLRQLQTAYEFVTDGWDPQDIERLSIQWRFERNKQAALKRHSIENVMALVNSGAATLPTADDEGVSLAGLSEVTTTREI